jgi:hypothetical protein
LFVRKLRPKLIYQIGSSSDDLCSIVRSMTGELREKDIKNYLSCEKAGTDVMITIFCHFRRFSAKKMAFFSKTNVMINLFHNLALL